jgi:hypothetical protein
VFDCIRKHCTVYPEVLVKADLLKSCTALGLKDCAKIVAEAQFALDPLALGWCDMAEFSAYLVKRCASAGARIRALTHEAHLGLLTLEGSGSGEGVATTRYKPPLQGLLRLKVVEGFNMGGDVLPYTPISHSRSKQVLYVYM